ncbi:MAG: hypothetical protein ABIR17_02745 [Pseudolysinimonas sp.]|uniref:hypothetical protein n=1 Tax=Pseudolysinimonas sp. TaxID=2680009 RepID=UPI0032640F7E
MPSPRSAIAVPLAAFLATLFALALMLLAPALTASADGSVPSEVASYATDGTLVAQLNDVYGPDAAGHGVDFDDTTKVGAISRVHVWSAALIAGQHTDHPIDLRNEWVVPITIGDAPVGLATIWINPASVRPELASFDADPDLAIALAAVPEGASVVRDDASRAWLALGADGIVTTLVAGSTGLSTPVPLDEIALLPAEGGSSTAADGGGSGVTLAVAVVVLLLLVIVVALALPGLLRRRKSADEPHDDAADVAAEDAAPAQAVPDEVAPDEVAPEEVETAKPKPRKAKPAPKG